MNTIKRNLMRAIVAVALAGCGSGDESTSAGSTDLATKTPKPPAGLMMRSGNPPPSSTQTFINSTVAMIDWEQIQPASSSDHVWGALDDMLATYENLGISHVRLRIMSGGHAPTWVKRLGAPNAKHPYFQGTVPTSVIDCTTGTDAGGVAAQNMQGASACVPFFWTNDYLAAYDNLMTLVRAHLDSLDASPTTYSQVATVVDSACMVVYAEVFYRGQNLGYTNQTLFEAGLTHDADINCQKSAIETHKNVFGATRRTSVAINDWDIPQGTPGAHGDYRTSLWNDGGSTWATYQFAEWAKSELTFSGGSTLLEVQNNGLHTNSACALSDNPSTSYWCYIAGFAGAHGFQTQTYVATPLSPSGASLTLLEDLDNALAMHAEYVELPSGMTATDWTLMGCYDDHLRNHNKTASCSH
jgi:hypothetical protein